MSKSRIAIDIADYPDDPQKHDEYESGKLHGQVVEQIGPKRVTAVLSALERQGYIVTKMADMTAASNMQDAEHGPEQERPHRRVS